MRQSPWLQEWEAEVVLHHDQEVEEHLGVLVLVAEVVGLSLSV